MALLRNSSARGFTLPKRSKPGDDGETFGGHAIVDGSAVVSQLGPGAELEVPEWYAAALLEEKGLAHLVVRPEPEPIAEPVAAPEPASQPSRRRRGGT